MNSMSENIFMDKRISWGAKGLYGLISSKYYDTDLTVSDIAKIANMNRAKASNYIKELVAFGYFSEMLKD